jgi:hypothetical protein
MFKSRIFVSTGAYLLRIKDKIELYQSTGPQRVDERMSHMILNIDRFDRTKHVLGNRDGLGGVMFSDETTGT